MKIYSKFVILSLLVFLLTACEANATATEEVTVSNVYTAAASTLTAQTGLITQTAAPAAFATLTLFSSPTTVPSVVRVFSQHFHSIFLVSSQQESLQFLQ